MTEEEKPFSSNDVLDWVGKILPQDFGRDAVHVAVIAGVAGEDLIPGSRVGFDKEAGIARTGLKIVGIVDPYLNCCVQEGERFWLFLLPKMTTSLRHHWEHPTFGKVNADTC